MYIGVDHSQLVDLAKRAFSFLPEGDPAHTEVTKYHGGGVANYNILLCTGYTEHIGGYSPQLSFCLVVIVSTGYRAHIEFEFQLYLPSYELVCRDVHNQGPRNCVCIKFLFPS